MTRRKTTEMRKLIGCAYAALWALAEEAHAASDRHTVDAVRDADEAMRRMSLWLDREENE